MNLLEKIETDLSRAMKNGDTLTTETLRMVKSDITYEKAKTGEDLEDDKILEVVTRAAKKRKESIKEFRKGNRDDLAEKEEAELAIIQKYLPEQMGDEEIEKAVDAVLASAGEVTQKDFGRVMGQVMKELKGKADGSAVKNILSKKLQSE